MGPAQNGLMALMLESDMETFLVVFVLVCTQGSRQLGLLQTDARCLYLSSQVSFDVLELLL